MCRLNRTRLRPINVTVNPLQAFDGVPYAVSLQARANHIIIETDQLVNGRWPGPTAILIMIGKTKL